MEKLKELRKGKRLSFQQMAIKLNISKTFYWQIECNERRLSYDMAIKIANIFKKKPDDIFYDERFKALLELKKIKAANELK